MNDINSNFEHDNSLKSIENEFRTNIADLFKEEKEYEESINSFEKQSEFFNFLSQISSSQEFINTVLVSKTDDLALFVNNFDSEKFKVTIKTLLDKTNNAISDADIVDQEKIVQIFGKLMQLIFCNIEQQKMNLLGEIEKNILTEESNTEKEEIDLDPFYRIIKGQFYKNYSIESKRGKQTTIGIDKNTFKKLKKELLELLQEDNVPVFLMENLVRINHFLDRFKSSSKGKYMVGYDLSNPEKKEIKKLFKDGRQTIAINKHKNISNNNDQVNIQELKKLYEGLNLFALKKGDIVSQFRKINMLLNNDKVAISENKKIMAEALAVHSLVKNYLNREVKIDKNNLLDMKKILFSIKTKFPHFVDMKQIIDNNFELFIDDLEKSGAFFVNQPIKFFRKRALKNIDEVPANDLQFLCTYLCRVKIDPGLLDKSDMLSHLQVMVDGFRKEPDSMNMIIRKVVNRYFISQNQNPFATILKQKNIKQVNARKDLFAKYNLQEELGELDTSGITDDLNYLYNFNTAQIGVTRKDIVIGAVNENEFRKTIYDFAQNKNSFDREILRNLGLKDNMFVKIDNSVTELFQLLVHYSSSRKYSIAYGDGEYEEMLNAYQEFSGNNHQELLPKYSGDKNMYKLQLEEFISINKPNMLLVSDVTRYGDSNPIELIYDVINKMEKPPILILDCAQSYGGRLDDKQMQNNFDMADIILICGHKLVGTGTNKVACLISKCDLIIPDDTDQKLNLVREIKKLKGNNPTIKDDLHTKGTISLEDLCLMARATEHIKKNGKERYMDIKENSELFLKLFYENKLENKFQLISGERNNPTGIFCFSIKNHNKNLEQLENHLGKLGIQITTTDLNGDNMFRIAIHNDMISSSIMILILALKEF